jgi:hypothetical protein
MNSDLTEVGALFSEESTSAVGRRRLARLTNLDLVLRWARIAEALSACASLQSVVEFVVADRLQSHHSSSAECTLLLNMLILCK